MEILISVNQRGALTLPKDVRRRIGMTHGGPMSVRVTAEGVLLVPVVALPVEVYTPARLAEFAEEEAKLARYKLGMKVFLDANVLYSASRPGSLMERFVLRLLRDAGCCTNAHALEEARRNLEANEPLCLASLAALSSRIQLLTEQVLVEEVRLPEKDRPILGGAVAGRCSHLLTSDRRDFGQLFDTVIHGVKVVSPQLMAEELGLKPARGGRPPASRRRKRGG